MALPPKPTIGEYDYSFGALRQNAKGFYDKLRTWILDGIGQGGGGNTPIDVTYADLVILIGSASLEVGSYYRITDFRSLEDIPNAGGAQATGVIEPLIVTALQVNEVSFEAFSEGNPQDIILYSVFNADFGADRGRITYREDTERLNSAYFDFRNFVFRRWDDGSGNFIEVTDNGNAFLDFPVFDPAQAVVCKALGSVGFLSNNTAFGNAAFVTFGENSTDNTLQANNVAVSIGSATINVLTGSNVATTNIAQQCNGVTIGSNANNIDIGQTSDSIDIGANSSNIKMGIFTDGQSIGLNCQNIIILDRNVGGVIGDDSTNITLGHRNNSCTIGANCVDITMGNQNANMDIGASGVCAEVRIGNACDSLIIGSGSYLTFDDSQILVTIGDNALHFNFGAVQLFHTIGDNCQNMTIGAEGNFATIGNNNDFITIGDFSINFFTLDNNSEIRVGNNNDTSTLASGHQNIVMGDNCGSNNIGANSNRIFLGNDCDAINISTDCVNVSFGENCNNITVARNALRLTFNDWVINRTTLAGEQDREDWRDRTRYNVVYDFATLGGAIGTFNLARIESGVTVVNAITQTITPLATAGGNADITLGVSTDGANGIIDENSGNNIFDGTRQNTDLSLNQDNDWIETTGVRQIVWTIATEPLTAGRVETVIDVQYPLP